MKAFTLTLLTIVLYLTVLGEVEGWELPLFEPNRFKFDLQSLEDMLTTPKPVNKKQITKTQSSNYDLSSKEKDDIKNLILQALGLNKTPSFDLMSIPEAELRRAKAEYHALVSGHFPKEKEEKYIDEDLFTVRSFDLYGKDTHLHSRNRRSAIENGHQIIWISVPENFKNEFGGAFSARAKIWKVGPKRKPDSVAEKFINVNFYWVKDWPSQDENKLQKTFLANKTISVYGKERTVLDISEYIEDYIGHPHNHLGISIWCPLCEYYGVKFPVIPNRYGKRVARFSFRIKTSGSDHHKTNQNTTRVKRKHYTPVCEDLSSSAGKTSNQCCRRSMKVRFSDLEGFDFIVAPREFNAYYCSGRCPPRYNPAYEHSLLQSFIHMKTPTFIPPPCCAAQELAGLQILHLNEEGQLKTTYWPDVVVTKCSCT